MGHTVQHPLTHKALPAPPVHTHPGPPSSHQLPATPTSALRLSSSRPGQPRTLHPTCVAHQANPTEHWMSTESGCMRAESSSCSLPYAWSLEPCLPLHWALRKHLVLMMMAASTQHLVCARHLPRPDPSSGQPCAGRKEWTREIPLGGSGFRRLWGPSPGTCSFQMLQLSVATLLTVSLMSAMSMLSSKT